VDVVAEIMDVDDVAQQRNIKKDKDRTFWVGVLAREERLLFKEPEINPEIDGQLLNMSLKCWVMVGHSSVRHRKRQT
jgi:hypothetical protein